MPNTDSKQKMPDDLKSCVEFHGHICPGLIYGYRVAKEVNKLMNIGRSVDEEVVAICKNDSCAVDALQVILGTVAGKGNLIIKNFGKNAYTGKDKSEFDRLEVSVATGTASEDDRRNLKRLKVSDLLARPFEEIFTTTEVPFDEPLCAPLASSEPCAICGEMTMATKMMKLKDGRQVCIPCSKKSRK